MSARRELAYRRPTLLGTALEVLGSHGYTPELSHDDRMRIIETMAAFLLEGLGREHAARSAITHVLGLPVEVERPYTNLRTGLTVWMTGPEHGRAIELGLEVARQGSGTSRPRYYGGEPHPQPCPCSSCVARASSRCGLEAVFS